MFGKSFFPRVFKVLVVITICIVAFARGELGQRILFCVFGLYAAMAAVWVWQCFRRMPWARRFKAWLATPLSPIQTPVPPQPVPSPPPAPTEKPVEVTITTEAGDKEPTMAALQHTNCRISDKLRSVYPDAVWEWASEAPESIALKGGEGRIHLSGTGEYNYADVTIDQLLNISFQLLKIVTLEQAAMGAASAAPVAAQKDADVETSDVAAWLDLVGRSRIDELLTEVNSRGHRRLFIEEGGAAYVIEDGAPSKQGIIPKMPAVKHWGRLVELLTTEGELQATMDGQQICLSWGKKY